jgi:hypothetical protein
MGMFGVVTSDDYQPVAWMGRYPIHVTTLLVIVHVVCTVLGCFLLALGGGALLDALTFDSAQVLHGGRLWEVATYAFVHPPSALLWFAIGMYMLFAFGREVERFMGRRAFITLYLLLLFAPTLLLSIWGLWQRTGLGGSAIIHLGIFIAFAAIYPNVELFLGLQAKWMALIVTAIYSLQLLASRVWPELAVLWISVALAYAFVQLRGTGLELGWLTDWTSRWRSKRSLRVVPRESGRRKVAPNDVHEMIDPVLAKISKSGYGSLTASEKRVLDQAQRLLNKPK